MLRAAAPLARPLLALGEVGYDGELWLEQRGRPVRVTLLQGRVHALAGVACEPLGDVLLGFGELDLTRQVGPRCSASKGRIGARLVAAGATSDAALTRALEHQLVRRIATLLRWPVSRLRRAPCVRGDSSRRAEGVALTAAVWSALLSLGDELSEKALTAAQGTGALVLTAVGARRARELARVQETGELARALAALGRRDLPCADAAAKALGPEPPESLRGLRACLRALDAAVEAGPKGAAGAAAGYGLLLRKHRELGRNASARVLLDLPDGLGSEHARNALRRLARTLHPDRFEAGDARLSALSTEVMSGLCRAEHALRSVK